MKSVSLNGIARVKLGKGFSKSMRKNGNVPCVIYGGGQESPVHIGVSENQLKKVIYTPNVYKISITVEEKSYETIIRDIQFHPVNDDILHVDFLQLQDDKPVSIAVPVKIKGNSIGILNGGKLNLVMRQLTVTSLPTDLPDNIEIDISDLRIGQSVRIESLDIKNVEFLHPNSLVVVSIKTARAAVDEDEEIEGESTEGESTEGESNEGGQKEENSDK